MPIADLRELSASQATLQPLVSASQATMQQLGVTAAVVRKGYSPYIDDTTGTWWEYDDDTKQYVDTGVKAAPIGLYDGLVASASEALIGGKSAIDQIPYTLRKTYSGAARLKEKIIGGTVAWNQLEPLDASAFTLTRVTLTLTGRTYTLTATSDSSYKNARYRCFTAGHKYYVAATGKCDNNYVFTVRDQNNAASTASSTELLRFEQTTDERKETIASPNLEYISFNFQTATTSGTVGTLTDVQVIDLTTMFGATIADYLYTLESGTAGAGVAKLKEWGFCTDDYYQTAQTGLQSVNLASHDMVGLNLFDKNASDIVSGYMTSTGSISSSTAYSVTGYIPVIGGTEYYISKAINSSALRYAAWYNDEKEIISVFKTVYAASEHLQTAPVNARYLRLTYANSNADTLTVNVSNSAINGTYRPYEAWSYPLDGSLTLRGVPKLDASNNLYFDGDEYEADGTVTRLYGTRAYQSGDESLADAITDGTNTVYKLSTATTETAQPYTEYQAVSQYGTEQYTDASVSAGTRDVSIPAGHYSEYYPDYVAKLDGLPSDFSTLIAPTEASYTATQNYSAGDLLIVDNILYRATAAIASGASITPGSNVTATTLAAIIKEIISEL